MPETSIDKLLGGRFAVEQPKKGYRIAVDTLLLAAAVPARAGQKILELGCGVGGVMLALATRLPDVSITGVELQPALAALCASNIKRNNWEDRLRVIEGDVAALPEALRGGAAHVMANPPYHDSKSHGGSANACKRIANMESAEADLSVWLKVAAEALEEGGTLTLIHRADRQDEITALAAPLFGEIRVRPICARENTPARRVIFRARKTDEKKGDPSEVILEPPFILYGADGRYCYATRSRWGRALLTQKTLHGATNGFADFGFFNRAFQRVDPLIAQLFHKIVLGNGHGACG